LKEKKILIERGSAEITNIKTVVRTKLSRNNEHQNRGKNKIIDF